MKKGKRSGWRGVARLGGVVLAFAAISACKKDDTPPAPGKVLPDKVYVADEESGTVTVLDASANKRIATIDLYGKGTGMLMTHNVQAAPDGKTVWVTSVPMSHGRMEYVVVIDPLADTILRRIPVDMHLHLAHIVLDDESRFAYVTANDAGKVLQIDAGTFTVTREYDFGDTTVKPHGLRYSHGKLFVACMGKQTLSVIDVATGNITDVPVGGMAVQSAVTPDGKYAFASLYDTREVVRYDVASGELSRLSLPTGAQGPIQLYPTPDGRSLLVCDQGNLNGRPASDKVYVIDIADMRVTNTIIAGAAAHGVVVSRDGKTAYVTNSDDNSVSVIDINSQSVKATVTVGFRPNGIAYWSEKGGMP